MLYDGIIRATPGCIIVKKKEPKTKQTKKTKPINTKISSIREENAQCYSIIWTLKTSKRYYLEWKVSVLHVLRNDIQHAYHLREY